MGRAWYLSWTNKSSSKKKAATGDSGRRDSDSGDDRMTTIALPEVMAAAASATGRGCMNVFFHLFDFHHLQHRFHQHTSSLDVDCGVQAPRNSMGSLEEMVSLASLIKHEKHGSTHFLGTRSDTKLKQVQAPRGKIIHNHSSEIISTPTSARTPSLVARLMGLHNLPESDTITPRLKPSSQPIHNPHMSTVKKTRMRCSSESPSLRSSSPSTRRRSTDDVIDLLPQRSIVKEIESSRPSCSAISTKRKKLKIYEEESKSPRYYARQIINQVSNNKVGVIDITNTIEQRNRKHKKDKYLSIYQHKSTTNDNTLVLCDSKVITKKCSKLKEETMLNHSNKPFLKSTDLIRNKKELIIRPSITKKPKKMLLSRDLVHCSVNIEGSSSKVRPTKKFTGNNTKQQLSRIPSQVYVEVTKKPYFETKPNIHQLQQNKINDFKLTKQLCMKMRNDDYCSSMDCQRVQDIDALAVKATPIQDISVVIQEEKEAIVSNIECDIIDSLVQEIVMLCFGYHFCSMQRRCISRIRR